MLNRVLPIMLGLCLAVSVHSQGVKISAVSGPPDPSAELELESTTQGFLLPRLTTSQRNAIVSPAIGLEIFNTTTNCMEVYFPLSGWRDVVCDCANPPSANFSFAPASPGIGTNVTFTPQVTGLTYNWTFQNGNPGTSNAQSPVVSWANGGTYTVTLQITDQLGCSANFSTTITVTNCPPGSQTFAYTGGLQTFTVPNCVTQVTIEAWGAQGGSVNVSCTATGGLGARMRGDVPVTPGEVLTILVGGQGVTNNSDAGGGGGSFVVRTGNVPLVVAGGGGGASNDITSCGGGANKNGVGGVTAQNGTASANGLAAGGTAGNGGMNVGGGSGGAGGGFNTAGSNLPRAGESYLNGGAGGTGLSSNHGGYGGGGCGWHVGGNGGGGGGYSGGGTSAAQPFSGGGGGGSYNIGSNQSNSDAVRSGNGQVVISW